MGGLGGLGALAGLGMLNSIPGMGGSMGDIMGLIGMLSILSSLPQIIQQLPQMIGQLFQSIAQMLTSIFQLPQMLWQSLTGMGQGFMGLGGQFAQSGQGQQPGQISQPDNSLLAQTDPTSPSDGYYEENLPQAPGGMDDPLDPLEPLPDDYSEPPLPEGEDFGDDSFAGVQDQPPGDGNTAVEYINRSRVGGSEINTYTLGNPQADAGLDEAGNSDFDTLREVGIHNGTGVIPWNSWSQQDATAMFGSFNPPPTASNFSGYGGFGGWTDYARPQIK
jgi:hypothetical protein